MPNHVFLSAFCVAFVLMIEHILLSFPLAFTICVHVTLSFGLKINPPFIKVVKQSRRFPPTSYLVTHNVKHSAVAARLPGQNLTFILHLAL